MLLYCTVAKALSMPKHVDLRESSIGMRIVSEIPRHRIRQSWEDPEHYRVDLPPIPKQTDRKSHRAKEGWYEHRLWLEVWAVEARD